MMKIIACITLNQSKELAHQSLHYVLFFWSLCLPPFWSTEGPYLSLSVKSLLETESLQMQSGMSDGLLFYLAAFSSVEMVRACARAHVCVYTFHYVPSRRGGVAFIFCPVIYDLLDTIAMPTC